MSNPDWTRYELILLIELYRRLCGRHMSPKCPEVLELSRLLNALPIHDPSVRDGAFRNADGVAMKLRNLQCLDPNSSAAGLARGGRLEAEVWDEFAEERERLTGTARAIRGCYRDLLINCATRSISYSISGYEEGQLLVRVHVLRERNATAARRKKQDATRRSGRLVCEVCGFDFRTAYGELGDGFAECHHTIALAALDHHRTTRMADLAIVCANCHRMLHRGAKWLSVGELQAIVRAHRHAATVGDHSRQSSRC